VTVKREYAAEHATYQTWVNEEVKAQVSGKTTEDLQKSKTAYINKLQKSPLYSAMRNYLIENNCEMLSCLLVFVSFGRKYLVKSLL